MTPEEIYEIVPWNRITEIVESHGLESYEAELCLRTLVLATTKWLPGDSTKTLLSVEREYVRGGLKGVADLVVLAEPDGSRTVIDWKTTGSVGPAWRRRHANAWQGPWYGYVAGPGVSRVIFRGIERTTGRGDEVEVPITEEVLTGVLNHYEVTENLRLESIARFPIRRGGYACYTFNEECPYYGERCLAGGVRQLALPLSRAEFVALTETPISPTSAERIWLCPHKNTLYQIDKLRGTEVTDDSSDASNFGTAFHAGIAEVYRVVLGGVDDR